ncbi:MAG: YrhA family protein [Rhizobacter sp.]
MTATTMYEDLVSRIHQEQRDAGEAVFAGASEARLDTLAQQVRSTFGAELPADYLDFLRQADGLDFNGFVVYDSHSSPEARTGHFWQGFIAANEAWRADALNRQCLVFGDTDTDLLLQHLPSGEFRRVDRVGRDLQEVFPSLRSMFEQVLAERVA